MELRRHIELRQRGKRLEGVIVQEGRAASVRKEIFTPGSVQWSANGINLRAGHGGRSVAVAFPERRSSGEISISVPINSGILSALDKHGNGLSVEFIALEERSLRSGIREIRRAYVDAAALVRNPEYEQATAEIRNKRRLKWL